MMTRKITTETILKTNDFEVIYFKGIDLDVCYAYQVYKNDELDYECDDRQEALDYVRDGQADLDSERAAARLQEMRDEAWDLVAGCEDEETIKKVIAMLKRAK
jgi:hypothetical protein